MVIETQQIYSTTSMITPLRTTIEPLLAEESYATVYLLSCPIVTTTVENPTDQDWSGQIIPPPLKEFSSTVRSEEFSSSKDSLPKIPELPVTSASFSAQDYQQHSPAISSVEISEHLRSSRKILTKLQTSYKKQLIP